MPAAALDAYKARSNADDATHIVLDMFLGSIGFRIDNRVTHGSRQLVR
jgi:hypothetical protein